MSSGIPRFQFPEDRPGSSRRTFSLSPPRNAGSQFQFSMSTLLLVMTLAAVCSTVIALETGLGIAFSAIALVALARTSVTGYLYRKVNVPLDLVSQVWEFGASCVLVMFAALIGTVCMALVGLTIFVVSAGPPGVAAPTSDVAGIIATCLGLGAGLLSFGATLWLSRPR